MAEMKTMLSAVEGVINGKVSAGDMILNDYRLIIEDIQGGHRLTVTRGSEVQSIDIMDGETGFAPTIEITSAAQPDVSGEIITYHTITVHDINGEKSIVIKDGAKGKNGTSSNVTVTQMNDGALIRSTVTDPDGNISSTMAIVKNGKAAYEYAKDGGYTGTETEFYEKLAQEIPEPYILPTASADVKGGVKVGDDFAMDEESLKLKTKIPAPSASDAGKFLRVDSTGTYALETLTDAEEVGF